VLTARGLCDARKPAGLSDRAPHGPQLGYRIHRSYYLPPINLTMAEVVGLLVLAKLASAERQRPMASAAMSAVRKLVGSVPETLREACLGMTRGLTAAPDPPAEADAETRFYAVLQRCVDEGRSCRVEYHAPLEPEPLVYKL
jgi:predicted DNA-binding transcriptional regulator YafY